MPTYQVKGTIITHWTPVELTSQVARQEINVTIDAPNEKQARYEIVDKLTDDRVLHTPDGDSNYDDWDYDDEETKHLVFTKITDEEKEELRHKTEEWLNMENVRRYAVDSLFPLV